MKLAIRGVIGITIIIGMVLIFVGIISHLALHNFLLERSFEDLESLAELQELRLEQIIKKDTERINGVTSRTQLRISLQDYNATANSESQAKIETIIADARDSISDFRNVSIINPAGLVVASTGGLSVGDDVSNREYFTAAREDDYISAITYDSEGQATMYLSGPLIRDDQFLGVAVMETDPTDVLRVATDYVSAFGETGETVIAKEEPGGGIDFFAPRRFEEEAALEPAERETMEIAAPMVHALQGEETVFAESLDYRGVEVFAASRYLDSTGWGLVVKLDKTQVLELGEFFRDIYLYVSLAALLLGALAAYLISRPITRSVRELQTSAARIASGDFSKPVEVKDRSEIGELAESFETMRRKVMNSRLQVESRVQQQTEELQMKGDQLEKQQTAVLNILEDVEEAKKISDREKERTARIIESIGDGVFVIDRGNRILLFNRVAEDLTGYSESEAIGQKYSDIIHLVFEKSGESDYKFVADCLREGEQTKESSPMLMVRKDGTSISVANIATPLRDSAGNVIGCVVVFRDVTKEREIDRMKTEFVSVASHQLRTPLSAIKWFLELLINGDVGKLSKEQLEYLGEAYRSNERMIALVNDLLNVSRIESGRLKIEPKETEIAKLASTIVSELNPVVSARKQEIKTFIPDDLPRIKIDPKLIGQVLQNLLSNASRYSDPGKPIELRVSVQGENMEFKVIDQGFGIPRVEQAKVFEKFFRADNAVKKVPEGTGLGLYVAKSVVEASGGEIGFESREGEGTTFWFTIPLSGSPSKSGAKSLI